MALVIETGSIVAGSNSYVSDAEYVAYSAARGLSFGKTQALRNVELIKAMDYLFGKESSMLGARTDDASSLPYPRKLVYIRGVLLDKNTIPQELKNAQMEAAVSASKFDLLIDGTQSNVQRQKLDTLEVEYFGGGSWETVRLDRVDNYLKHLLKSNDGILTRV